MHLRQAASLWIAALMCATGAFADVRGVRLPPAFTAEEIDLISRDPRLLGATKLCARQLRQALDALAEITNGSRVGMVQEPCPTGSTGHGRASDEGALDILKILKDISEQGTSRSGPGDGAHPAAGHNLPSFTGEEMELIQKDKRGRLIYAARRCAWQLRHALDSLRFGYTDWPPQRPCRPLGGESTRGTDEGALDILKILREASGEASN
jgi:hypothetical protein